LVENNIESSICDEETMEMLNARKDNHLENVPKSYNVEESMILIRQHSNK